MPSRILIVEDEAVSALHLEARIESLGYLSGGIAYSGEQGIELARQNPPALVLMDIKLSGVLDGIEAGQFIQSTFNIPVVYLTAFSDANTVARARKSAPFGYLVKPVREDALRTAIEMALEQHALQRRLAESNSDLERFAAIAAHDLKAPVRQIHLSLSLLQRECGDLLNPNAHEYIEVAQSAAKRMQALIDDLLEYSLVTHDRDTAGAVDLNAALAQTLGELKGELEKKRAVVKSAQLPVVKGSVHQLTRLLGNLICNSIRYNTNVPPVVSVISRVEDGMAITSVIDNGVGISPEHVDRVFEIFQRGHSGIDVPGSGVGLASCKKIVELHGGRIWVQSTPGMGSTFSFSLPVMPAVQTTGSIE